MSGGSAGPSIRGAYRTEFFHHAMGKLLVSCGPMDARGRRTVLGLGLLVLAALAAWVHQLRHGLAVTAMGDYFSWGVYIVDFVFFIGISMAGTLISAFLRLSGAPWRHPITRMAEGITVCALLVAAPMIIVDMGRPDRILFTLSHARLQSPILWDILSLATYLAGSLLYLYLPLIPDLALMRDQADRFPGWAHRFYRAAALGWRGTEAQHRHLDRAVAVMAIAIIPVAVSIHTVTAWLFGLTLRPGWHSTILGPDFVAGAVYSGVAAVITFLALFRGVFRLGRYLLPLHFQKLAKLLAAAGLVYAYFTFNELVGGIYVKEASERPLLDSLFSGAYAGEFWFMAVFGLALPVALLLAPHRRSIRTIVGASILVNIGMWIMRFLIIVPTLAAPYMPIAGAPGTRLVYSPTWVEWTLTAGAFAAFGLIYIAFSRLFPVISIWELVEEHEGKEAAHA
jgi:molybdopterin-containing oxidoreductase family membrane subunit